MFNRSNLLIVVVAILGALLGLYVGTSFNHPHFASLSPDMGVLGPGDHLTDLELPDIHGTAHRLGDWHGKLVLINFWATWCEPCREEMPLLDLAVAQYSERGLAVVGVAVDDPDSVRDLLNDEPVSYPILIGNQDTLKQIGDGDGGLPYSLLIGPNGKMVSRHEGSFPSAALLAAWLRPHLLPPS
ncbi:MAG: TlpA family protein disulfide reductase [Rudaea sp.]